MTASTADAPGSAGPIGVFDSGVGGLSVLRALAEAMPHEDLIYVADSANCPYGAKPISTVRELSVGITEFLMGAGAKLIVVACNTASAVALSHLRAIFDMSFVGMVPAVKPAAESTQSGVIGVLATANTLHGQLYRDVVGHFRRGAQVLSCSCEGLAERIEQGDLDGPGLLDLLHRYIDPMVRQGADVLVLGCTHYPLALPAIQRVAGPGVRVIEPSEAIARRAQSLLVQEQLQRQSCPDRRIAYLTTGDVDLLASNAQRHLGHTGAVGQVAWIDGALARVRS